MGLLKWPRAFWVQGGRPRPIITLHLVGGEIPLIYSRIGKSLWEVPWEDTVSALPRGNTPFSTLS